MPVEIAKEKSDFKNNKSVPIESTIKRIIEKEGFIKYKVNKRCVSSSNSNFLGILYNIDVKGKTKNGEKELNIFMKTKTIGDNVVKIVSIPNIFKTETFAYNELFKIFDELQKGNVPFKKRYKTVKSYEDNTGEAIILDNIAIKGFNTYYRMNVASYNYVEKCVMELAKFHGLSFVLEDRNPEYFYKKIKPLKISYVNAKDNVWESFVDRVKDMTMEYVDDEYKGKVEKIYQDVARKYIEYYNDETVKVCLCHGDYRPSNIMVKYKNGGGVMDIIPVDYQLIHYGCPIFDLLYFIYFCTDREFRKNHMMKIKNLYYNSLQEFLKDFGLNAEVVYSRDTFKKTFKERLDFGLMVSLLYLCFMFVSENCVIDMGNISFQIDGRFEKRLRGTIEEFIEWGFI